MKRILALGFSLCFLAALCAGCSQNKGTLFNETTSTESNIQFDEGSLHIFTVSRDVFQLFLENSDINIIKTQYDQHNVYSELGEGHITWDVTYFELEKEFMDFVGSYTTLETYLHQNGISGQITELFMIDAPKVPLTLCVITDNQNAFITLEEWDPYTYSLYTQQAFSSLYSRMNAKLTVCGKSIDDTVPLYHDYADLPLMSVLEAMGAKILRVTYYSSIVYVRGTFYFLNTKEQIFQEFAFHSNNALFVLGPKIAYSSKHGELMVSDDLLYSVLDTVGEHPTFTHNRENTTVMISRETGSAPRIPGFTVHLWAIIVLIGSAIVLLRLLCHYRINKLTKS